MSDGAAQPVPGPSRPPARRGGLRRLKPLLATPAWIPAALLALMVGVLAWQSDLLSFNASVFFGTKFDPTTNTYGVGIMIVGSFLTSVPALLVAMGIAIGVSVTSVLYLPKLLARTLDPFIDLLAGIPSVVIGLWGLLIIAPYLHTTIEPWMVGHLGFIPYFQAPISPDGTGPLLAIVVLTLMILPITTVLVRDSLRTIPRDLWESGLALGATRWEVTKGICLRYAGRGIWAAGLIGFARAMGEAVAVSMVIGNGYDIPPNIYGGIHGTNTLPALLIEQIDEAQQNPAILSTMVEVALFLMLIALAVNLLGRAMIRRLEVGGAYL